jgi:hypothetical protein
MQASSSSSSSSASLYPYAADGKENRRHALSQQALNMPNMPNMPAMMTAAEAAAQAQVTIVAQAAAAAQAAAVGRVQISGPPASHRGVPQRNHQGVQMPPQASQAPQVQHSHNSRSMASSFPHQLIQTGEQLQRLADATTAAHPLTVSQTSVALANNAFGMAPVSGSSSSLSSISSMSSSSYRDDRKRSRDYSDDGADSDDNGTHYTRGGRLFERPPKARRSVQTDERDKWENELTAATEAMFNATYGIYGDRAHANRIATIARDRYRVVVDNCVRAIRHYKRRLEAAEQESERMAAVDMLMPVLREGQERVASTLIDNFAVWQTMVEQQQSKLGMQSPPQMQLLAHTNSSSSSSSSSSSCSSGTASSPMIF